MTNPKDPQPFAYKAAQIAFACPFVAIVFALCLNFALGTMTDSSAAGMIGTARLVGLLFCSALYVIGLVMGIVALASIRRYGAKGLVVRPVIGMVLSALILFIIVAAVGREPATVKTTKAIVGDWYSKVSNGGQSAHVHMRLSSDGTGTWELTDGPNPMSFHGVWKVGQVKDSPNLGLTFKFDPDAKTPANLKGLGWSIEQFDSARLELSTNDTQGHRVPEIYTRTIN